MWSYLDVASWLGNNVRTGYPNASIKCPVAFNFLIGQDDVKFEVMLS
jgi:hypothetical protein